MSEPDPEIPDPPDPPEPPAPLGILGETKKALGVPTDYDVFDVEIVMHINSVFGDLHQLGLGPDWGFEIEDDTALWSDYIQNDPRFNGVKTYMYLRLRLLFDPPDNYYTVEAFKKEAEKFEWRLNFAYEANKPEIP